MTVDLTKSNDENTDTSAPLNDLADNMSQMMNSLQGFVSSMKDTGLNAEDSDSLEKFSEMFDKSKTGQDSLPQMMQNLGSLLGNNSSTASSENNLEDMRRILKSLHNKTVRIEKKLDMLLEINGAQSSVNNEEKKIKVNANSDR